MPAFLTHLLAANDSFGKLAAQDREALSFDFNSYLWGAVGPDVLYFHSFISGRSPLPGYGTVMHDHKTGELLTSIGKYVAGRRGAPDYNMLVAYQSGFYSHYHLDSITHPYIYSQAKLFEGLSSDRVHGGSHHRIEADISSVLYRVKTGQSVYTFSPRQRLRYDRVSIMPIAFLISHTLMDVYGIMALPEPIADSFGDTLNAQMIIHDPTGFFARTAATVADLIRGSNATPFASRVCHDDVNYDVLGRSHREWFRCDDKTSSREGYLELFDKAVDASSDDIGEIIRLKSQGEAFTPPYVLPFTNGAPKRR